jgi:hypothetical protein
MRAIDDLANAPREWALPAPLDDEPRTTRADGRHTSGGGPSAGTHPAVQMFLTVLVEIVQLARNAVRYSELGPQEAPQLAYKHR